ncbi:MAG: SDR family NAD(P)-dependent oxidoreductase [Candidatus Binataceae bacterium]
MNELAEKVAIVTGGGHGIGRRIASVYARAGAKIVIAARAEKPMRETCAELERAGCRALYIPTNVASEADCDRMIERALSAWGRADILVNNAGVAGPTAKLTDMKLAEWQEVIDVNLTGCWLASRAAIKHMATRGSGDIVNISSLAGREAYPMRTPYAASKWAMIGLTQSLAKEWGRNGIRVNCICPGPVAGDRIGEVIKARAAAQGLSEEQVSHAVVGRTSMGRMVTEDECAQVALFLVTQPSSGLTGQSINVDAGLAMN